MPEIDLKKYAQQFHSDWSAPPKGINREGYVYYCGDGEGRIKIGFSKNPWSRLRECMTWNPSMRLLATERGPMRLEGQRHKEFSEYHLALEWFKYEGRLKELIEELGPKSDTPRWTIPLSKKVAGMIAGTGQIYSKPKEEA